MEFSSPIFLVAVPQMGDPNFFRGVILILQHDAEGAMGLALNRPTELSMAEFARSQDLLCHPSLESMRVFQGGPVETERGWLLHRDSSLAERRELLPDFFVSGGLGTLKILLAAGKPSFRFFLGYAGWGAGQLEGEMKAGAWVTAPADPKYVFDVPPERVWETVLRDLGIDPYILAVGGGEH